MLVASLAISSTPAAAAESGVYVAANYGRAPKLFARADLDAALLKTFSGTLTLDSTSVEKNGSIWSAGLGYRMGENFAVEATYLDLGKIHYETFGTAQLSGKARASHVELDTKSRGPALALVWALPLWNEWGVDARAGVYRGQTNTDLVSTLDAEATTHSVSRTSMSLLLGIGGSYLATEHLTVRLDYLHLNDIKEKSLADGFDADIVTAGVTYEF
jgi:opacity protein-like surface antigen